ncbi:cytochrome c oxidase accessory protein CcoG [Psychrobium sp. 1_MG-2023]|uniref:cytochrome c oxidase accessory protein CcoG n=1 Tax=Psychrobium sp. 1_MG-2023 TaxID=3062624 RepID=UPI000C31FD52|nr:cytochrome c oxidase accessory protein CcoG [Psychrobium sp. 1_MG-2023]MDP2560526.1 cytochrome c oxidase accessory protein CcoG [Psychrobium sp. 1_MG-2023]PKF53952.1 cytochrome c oxidase accessory protein CcoG [Alteromonadales bacterium alter-6D02]
MDNKIAVKVIDPKKSDRKGKNKPPEDNRVGRKIYVRAVDGFFTQIRQRINWILMLGFFILPWIPYGDRQAILFDLVEQKFHIFGLIIWPQDLVLFAALLMISAYALFLVTTFIGRVWCGYTCPQTIWTFIFIWFEEKIEGKFNKRKKLDQQPLTLEKFWKKTLKHTVWLFISLITSLTFVAFFVPVQQLYIDFFTWNSSGIIVFWVLFFTFCTYGNAGWMREIMCLHMCPYARFQSAMFDKDTYTVAYDAGRGEDRGPRSRKKDPKELGLGDCIDCNLCVQVCPTGIDIRDGLQYECINCGACVDACDDVMVKMGYDKKLISYTTERQLEGKKTHIVRSKLLGYSAVLLVMCGVFVYFLMSIQPAKLDIIRDRNQLYRISSEGLVENVYTLKVLNKTEQDLVYQLDFDGIEGYQWNGPKNVPVKAGEVLTLPMSISIDPYNLKKHIAKVEFSATTILPSGERVTVKEESRFFNEI